MSIDTELFVAYQPGIGLRLVGVDGLSSFLVEHSGGGYNQHQTARAMETLRSIRAGTTFETRSGMTIDLIARAVA